MCVVGGWDVYCVFSGRKQKKGNGGICPSRDGWSDLEQTERGRLRWGSCAFEGPVELVSLGKAHNGLGNMLWLFGNVIFQHIFLLVTHPSCSLEEQVS